MTSTDVAVRPAPDDVAQLDPDQLSWMERLALSPTEEAERILADLTEVEAAGVKWDWSLWARPDQLPPADDLWRIFLIVAGRGAGKTRANMEWVRKRGPLGREGVLVGANPRDVRDVLIEGRSGILNIAPPSERPKYEPSKLLLTWPNGAIAHVRSAEDPEGLRGLSADWAAVDEPAKFRYLRETWDNLRLALREGTNPQTFITTTPKPLPLLRDLLAGKVRGTVVAPRVSTFRNRAHLSPEFLAEMAETYEGTRLGFQELHGILLEDVEGALWTWAMIEACRWKGGWRETEEGVWVPGVPEMQRKVVGVDPAGSSVGAETGIVVAGRDAGKPPKGYVLGDYSLHGTPAEWGFAAIQAYTDHDCDAIVAERNYGGEMVEHVIRTVPAQKGYPSGSSVRVKVTTAQKSKKLRAEPIVGLYEQGRIAHVGTFGDLEGQQCSWVPDEGLSPDRVDASVHALTELLVGVKRSKLLA